MDDVDVLLQIVILQFKDMYFSYKCPVNTG